ncbi:MAG: hypothetical protein QM655_16485, partial [Nocardioidaceae bacterium]
MEAVGPEHTRLGWVPLAIVEGRIVSRLTWPRAIRAADTMSKDARAFRVTSELATTPAHGIS